MNSLRFNQTSLSAISAALACASSPAFAQDAAPEQDIDTIVSSAPAPMPERPIVPLGGNISPFHGNIDPFAGNIDPFGGQIDPFAGNIDPFGGNINPFYGDIEALWGTIDPFAGNIDPFAGNIDPFGGNISPFYGQIDPFVGNTDPISGAELPSYMEFNTFWNEFGATWEQANVMMDRIQTRGSTTWRQNELSRLLSGLFDSSETVWGEAVTARTDSSFDEGFLNPLFARYGITGDRKAGFLALTKGQRAQLVMEWFDGLMDYTGNDHVDHWMKAVNWSPDITTIQGSGADSVIGILDGSIADEGELAGRVFSAGGYTSAVGGHGTGVASLMVAAHDGRGVYGIAPHAQVATYNPFDNTGTASWDDVRAGIVSLKGAGASVINMSLGVPGWTFSGDWNDVFTHADVRGIADDTVFVVAAGNDGITQTQNIIWNDNDDIALLLVGSVDPLGNISSFSNRPGDACMQVSVGSCDAAGSTRLRDIFLVAPGDLILMADGNGGLVRRSGTSFAAPLVSGAITLLHDRWPWLTQHSQESADIILQSATDLGAKGVDDVYGHGLLNIEASQSPLNFNDLVFFQSDVDSTNALGQYITTDAIVSGGIGADWDTDGVYMTAFEFVGDTYRDFSIPLSDRLVGQKSSAFGTDEYFQTYIRSRFVKWVESDGVNTAGSGFTDVASSSSPKVAGWTFGVSASSPVVALPGENDSLIAMMPEHTAMRFTNESGRLAFNAGVGQGSMELLGNTGFGLMSDYRANNGGLNPVLGLASGGGFVDAELSVGRHTKIGFGVTERRLDHSENLNLTIAERNALAGQRDYAANAFNMRIEHSPHRDVSLTLSAASVNERDALLGVQSAIDSDMTYGSNSKTLTLGGNVALVHGFDIAASATVGSTHSNDGARQNIRTQGGVTSTAFAVSLGKRGVVGKRDMLRLSLTQPLHIESGTLEYSSVEITDRTSGELGTVDRTFDISDSSRRYTAEVLYAAPLSGNGEVSLFARADMNGSDEPRLSNVKVNEIIAGGVVSFSF